MNRSSMTLHDKIALLDDAKEGVHKATLAQKYGCDKSTVWRLMRNETKIRELGQNMNLKRKRNRKSVHQNIEDSLNMWVKREQERNRVLTRELVLKTAQGIATRLQSDFVPTSTWIWRWSKRVNVKLARSSKETDVPSGDEGDDIESIILYDQVGKVDVKPASNVSSSTSNKSSFEEVLLQNDDDEDMVLCSKEEMDETEDFEPQPIRHDKTNGAKKHSWLSQLVLTQIESIHPEDRGDFAWEVHKLIRKYQMKNKMRLKD